MAPELQATPHSITGFAPDTLIAASKAAGTVVVGAHGRSAIPTVLLGSVSQQVAIHSSCPVVVVRESRTQGGVGSGHVVVGVDGSEASEPALGYAFAYAASTGRSLTAVHTWWWEPMEGLSLDEPWARDWTQIARQEEALVAESRSRWPAGQRSTPMFLSAATSSEATRSPSSSASPMAPACLSWDRADVAGSSALCLGRSAVAS